MRKKESSRWLIVSSAYTRPRGVSMWLTTVRPSCGIGCTHIQTRARGQLHSMARVLPQQSTKIAYLWHDVCTQRVKQSSRIRAGDDELSKRCEIYHSNLLHHQLALPSHCFEPISAPKTWSVTRSIHSYRLDYFYLPGIYNTVPCHFLQRP